MMVEESGKTVESLARQLDARPADRDINEQAIRLLLQTLERSKLRDRDKLELKDEIRYRGPRSILRAS
jgi:hypothetical protein